MGSLDVPGASLHYEVADGSAFVFGNSRAGGRGSNSLCL
jgi:hypothetical protein